MLRRQFCRWVRNVKRPPANQYRTQKHNLYLSPSTISAAQQIGFQRDRDCRIHRRITADRVEVRFTSKQYKCIESATNGQFTMQVAASHFVRPNVRACS